MSTYTSNIPKATDDPSQSQLLLLNNFQALAEAIDLNHIDMSNTAERGKHKFLQMPEQTDPFPTTVADEGALFTKEEGGTTQLFYREESDGAQRQLTGAFVGATNGSVTIPGGLVIAWGREGMDGNTTKIVTVPIITTFLNALVTPFGDVSRIFAYDTTGTADNQFRILGQTASTTIVSWLAFGV